MKYDILKQKSEKEKRNKENLSVFGENKRGDIRMTF